MVRSASLFLAASLSATVTAQGAELYSQDGIEARWDNTLRYSVGARLSSQNSTILSYPNGDDGDRAFAQGLMSSRLDLLSVFDLTGETVGLQASVAAWYDTVYFTHNDDRSGATTNATSVPFGSFTHATRSLDGVHADLADTFVYGNFAIEGMPVSLRLGRQTVLWGESLFFGDGSIASAQAPADYIKSTSTPYGYSRNVFLPVNQIFMNFQPSEDISIAAYYQLEWRPSRLPGVGSYFSTSDLQGAGAERAFLESGQTLAHAADLAPSGNGQFGLSLHKTIDDLDLGLYALRYDAKYPMLVVPRPPVGTPTTFVSTYPSGVELYGLSFSTYVGDSNIAGEVAARRHSPLVSTQPISPYLSLPVRQIGSDNYAEGDTLHARLSSVTTLAPMPLWDSADLSAEVAATDLLGLTADPDALARGRSHIATNVRALFQPHYFSVLPNLDASFQLGTGFNISGRSVTDYTGNAGTGDVELGLSAVYMSVWKMDLTLTSFIGAPSRQPLADRDFLLLGLERTL
ncbi:MAG TPA: DUF1302 family protein [Rhizomicrobium sp.]|jgi:hypothetical protein